METTSKENILNRIRASVRERKPVDYPTIPNFVNQDEDALAVFKQSLTNAHGTWYEVSSIEEAQDIMKKQLPDAKVIASATEEWKGNKDWATVIKPKDLADVDLGIIRAEFGVAEMGSVWLTNKDLKVDALGFLSQHLAILLDPDEIVENMHLAYKRVTIPENRYGCFMMEPSATGDIEGKMVYGAQGCRTLTLFFIKPQ